MSWGVVTGLALIAAWCWAGASLAPGPAPPAMHHFADADGETSAWYWDESVTGEATGDALQVQVGQALARYVQVGAPWRCRWRGASEVPPPSAPRARIVCEIEECHSGGCVTRPPG